MIPDYVNDEEEYEKNIEKKVLNGVIHPRFIRWFKEDTRNDEPLDEGITAKQRYTICKGCDTFNNILKICDKCKCFMPVKVQLKKSKCPLDKW